MDKLLNEFTVHRPIDQTWAVLTDVERIAPCLPGAQLEEIEGEIYRGVVKVKLGAISTAFKGQATFVERDDTNHRAVLHGAGRDTTGKGNADATITARLESISADATKCVVETDLHITGKVAQFGRGIMGDVSKKLMAQFAQNLNTMLDEAGEEVAPAASASSTTDESVDRTVVEPATAASTSSDESSTGEGQVAASTASAASNGSATSADIPKVRKIEGPASDPIELSDVAGSAILKRVLPLIGGLVVVLLVLRRLRRR